VYHFYFDAGNGGYDSELYWNTDNGIELLFSDEDAEKKEIKSKIA
jgi:hypothetical protein